MIVVATMALGLVGARLLLMSEVPIPYIFPFEHFIEDSPLNAILALTIIVISLTFAGIAIPVASFRYRLRRLLRFPGMASCCGAVASLLMDTTYWGIRAVSRPYEGTVLVYLGGITLLSLLWCGIGVVTAVMLVAGAGCRRLPLDWIDWSRLVMSLYWISMFFVVVGWR
jgi:hypothetical protein